MTPSVATGLRGLLGEAPLTLRVAGGCMTPTLVAGSRPALVPAGRLWPGDVVAFLSSDGVLVAHRVLASLPGRIYTQADRGASPDAALPRWRLVGRLDVAVAAPERLRALRRFGRVVACVIARRFR